MLSDMPVPAYVVDRESELRFIEDNLISRNVPVLVTGAGGAGKTMLLRMCAHKLEHLYQQVCLLSLYSYGGNGLFPYLASQLGATSTGQQDVVPLLSQRECLILADGLDAVPIAGEQRLLADAKTLIKVRGASSLLLSSRNANLLQVVGSQELAHLRLSGLSLDDVRKLAVFHGVAASEATLSAIHARTSGHPLALHLLFKLIQGGTYTETEFLTQLEAAFQQQWGSRLTNFLVVHTPDGFRAYPASSMESVRVITSTARILTSAPYVIVPNIRHFWREQLEEFEELLNAPNIRESQFQRFFESHPHFLMGLDYRSVMPHPVLQRGEEGPLIPDFFLQPLYSEFCDILDLKLPSKKLIVGSKDRKRFGHSVQDAIAQLREYHDYFENPAYRQRVGDRYGLTAYRPSVVVIIGRTPESVDEVKFRQITTQHPGLQILTYDQLHQRMKRLVELGSF